MISLPAVLIGEKNDLTSAHPWLVLLEIQFDGDTIRLVRNEADVTWDSQTWTRFPFELDVIGETRRGEVPAVTLRVSNISRVIQAYIEDYDGGVDADVIIRVVHANHLSVTTPALRLDYIVTNVSADSKEVRFTLGAGNLLRRRFPAGRFLQNFCRWRFKSTQCGYAGAETECSKTLSRCRELANSPRFGGFPGVGVSGVKL